jgi:benzaldehyde dehydrogenase (NAD)
MGVADQINWVDAACWNGTAFDGGWNTRLASHQDVLEPATSKPLWRVGVASAADMTAAIERAQAAQAAWAATPPRERAAVLLKAAQALFEQRFDELALMAIARETGGIVPKGQHEVREAVVLCQLAAAMPMQAQGQVLPSTPGRMSMAKPRAARRGGRDLAVQFPADPEPALGGAGPGAGQCGGAEARCAHARQRRRDPGARCSRKRACPPVCCRCWPGNAEAGEALVTDPRVPMIAFTGSPGVGRRIGELAGRHLKKVSLELGGANNLIVLEDADLDAAASAVAFGAWFHQGQICMASNRVLVHESVLEGLKARLVGKATHLPVGDGASGRVALGPMIDAKQLARFDSVVKASIAAGRQAGSRRHV